MNVFRLALVPVVAFAFTLPLLQRGAPVPVKSSEPPKTRRQVIDEMRAESPDARRARLELLTGG